MNGKQLKNSILQWAIQGKLVPQDPNDEPASVLLDKIRQEKERLIKEKKIKRDKNTSIIYRGEDNSYYEKILATGEVKCIDEEIPFDIPQGWEWERFGNVMINKDSERIPLSVAQRQHLKKTYDYYGASGVIDKVDKYLFDKDLLLIGEDGANLINRSTPIAFIAKGKYWVNNHAHVLDVCSEMALSYVALFINAISLVDYVTGTAQPKMNQEKMNSILLAIPPVKEQHRILEKMSMVDAFVDKYASLQTKLDSLDNSVYELLRKSILQEAIQGKLVPQIAKEGTAQELLEQIKAEKQKLVKEGKLKKSALNDSVIFRGDDNKYCENLEEGSVCIDDEIPFDIPANWAWVRLDDICSFIHRGKSPKYSLIKKYPVVAQKCNQWSGFSLEKAKFVEPQSISSYKEEYLLQDEDLMWNSTGLGTLGRMAIYYKKLNPYELAVADSHVTVIRPYKQYVVSEYLYYYFASNTVQSVIEDKSDGSTKQKELSTKTVKSYLVPLPPMEEQKRIVEKVEELTQLLK